MTAERENDFMYLPLNCGPKAPLSFSWGLGNKLFVFPHGRPEKLANAGDRLRVEDANTEISEVRWNVEMHGDITRKLVNESHNIFVMLQGQRKSLSGAALHTQLVKASKHYRSVLKACSLELLQFSDNTTDEHEQTHCENQLQMFELIHLIWSLCEILFINTSSDGLVLRQLLEWLQWHFSDGKSMALEVQRDESPDSHPAYWDAIYRLILQGDVNNVQKLLSLHSSSSVEAFCIVDEMLRKMPQVNYSYGLSVTEYDIRWRHWREECSQLSSEQQFVAFPQLDTLVKILIGDDDTMTEMKDYCETWYHLLVSKMLFQNPAVKPVDLHFYTETCMEVFCRDGTRLGEIDNILQAALEFNIHQVIKDCSSMLSTGSWWFASHLTDILHHGEKLDTSVLAFGSNLREYLFLEYASSLMSHKSLWQVGVDYLDECPIYGQKYLELYLEKIPIDTEKKAEKILHICEERNLMDNARSICKMMGMKCYRTNRLGSAMSWFLRSKDVAASTRLADKFLLEYTDKGQFSHLDLLDSLGPSMLLSNRLTFLGKYREFQKMYESGDFTGAGSLLLSLLSARLAPKTFWITLLMDALPLLESPQVIFDSSKTYELQHCLEELLQDLIKGNHSHKKQTFTLSNAEKEQLDLLRLALIRNLARAIIHEGTLTPSL